MIVLRYSLIPEDHYKFNYYRFWVSPSQKKVRLKYYVKFILSLVFGGVIIHLFSGRPIHLQDVCVFSFLILAGVLTLPDISNLYTKRQVERLLEDPKNSSYLGETELIITDGGIINKDKSSESKYKWSAFVSKEETKEYYYLYLSSIMVITIPKRIFTTEIEKKAFELYLIKYLSLEVSFEEFKSASATVNL